MLHFLRAYFGWPIETCVLKCQIIVISFYYLYVRPGGVRVHLFPYKVKAVTSEFSIRHNSLTLKGLAKIFMKLRGQERKKQTYHILDSISRACTSVGKE